MIREYNDNNIGLENSHNVEHANVEEVLRLTTQLSNEFLSERNELSRTEVGPAELRFGRLLREVHDLPAKDPGSATEIFATLTGSPERTHNYVASKTIDGLLSRQPEAAIPIAVELLRKSDQEVVQSTIESIFEVLCDQDNKVIQQLPVRDLHPLIIELARLNQGIPHY